MEPSRDPEAEAEAASMTELFRSLRDRDGPLVILRGEASALLDRREGEPHDAWVARCVARNDRSRRAAVAEILSGL